MDKIVLKMNQLPTLIELVGDDGKKKFYQVVPAGKHGACLNKAPEPKTK